MQASTTILEWTKNRFEKIGRARVCAVLRDMDSDLLKRAGIDPVLLQKGPDAWPWRAVHQEYRLQSGFSIDERGTPVPIGSAADLDRLAARKPSHKSGPDSTTHLAA